MRVCRHGTSFSGDSDRGATAPDEVKRLERTAEKCRRLLEKTPDNNVLLLLMAGLETMLGHPDAATQWLEKSLALVPDSADTWFRYGFALMARRECGKAAIAFDRAVELNPGFAEAHYHRGAAYMVQGKWAEAVEAFEGALAVKPDYPQVLYNLGNVLKEQGKLPDALRRLEHAVELNPGHWESLNSLGSVLFRLGRLDAAAAVFREALELKPDSPDVLNNLGIVLRLQNHFDGSIACLARALKLQPRFTEAFVNLGNSLYDIGMLRETITVLERAVGLKSDYPDLRKNLGIALLAAGRFEEGWREYEWRWQGTYMGPARRDFSRPQWKGEAAEGRVLLIHAEQGFGDTLQFCRYVPLAAARGLRVALMAPPELVRLLETLDGVETLLPMDRPLPEFDLHCPMMSLPLAFGTRLDNIPAAVPYLFPEREALLAWNKRLPEDLSGRLRVGLVWSGRARLHSAVHAAVNLRRSVTPEVLAPLLDVPGVQFFSLQKDGPPAPPEFGLIDLMEECRDFADTAAFIANLDLVVSVDTAVVHLAGALGKPVWVLNRFDSCWRWLRDRDDSPWYPTLRLFRQVRPGDWEGVIARVREELEGVAATAGPPGTAPRN